MIDAKLQADLRAKFNPDGSEIRKVQLTMRSMLIFFDKLCRQYNLSYWIDSGTLLGAKRHGGFIPWDDDLDVGMMRQDALRLQNIMGNQIFDGRYILQTSKTDPNYVNSSWFTLRDTKVEYLQDTYLHNHLKYRGIQIDIFIFEEGVSPFLKKLCTGYQSRLVIGPLTKSHSVIRPFAYTAHKILERIIAPTFRFIKFNKYISKGYGNPFGKPYKNDTIFPLKEIPFEGYNFYSPNNPDIYLNKMYGDWENIPTLEKIKTHAVKFKFLE